MGEAQEFVLDVAGAGSGAGGGEEGTGVGATVCCARMPRGAFFCIGSSGLGVCCGRCVVACSQGQRQG